MAKFYLLTSLAVIVSIITLASFLKFQRYAFYNQREYLKEPAPKEIPFPMVLHQHDFLDYYLCASQFIGIS